jgi:hypothetical protein
MSPCTRAGTFFSLHHSENPAYFNRFLQLSTNRKAAGPGHAAAFTPAPAWRFTGKTNRFGLEGEADTEGQAVDDTQALADKLG